MVRWVPRNSENGDCAIIALQLACGLTYEEVLAAAVLQHPDVVSRGLLRTEIRRLASKLGYATKTLRKGRYDMAEDTGLLYVSKEDFHHAVYLWKGRIIEPGDQVMWADPEDYLECMELEAGCLLTLTRKKK
jgi:hypothetical protein